MNKNEGIVRLNIGYYTSLILILLRVSSDEIYVINEDDKTLKLIILKHRCAFSNITRLRSDLIIF